MKYFGVFWCCVLLGCEVVLGVFFGLWFWVLAGFSVWFGLVWFFWPIDLVWDFFCVCEKAEDSCFFYFLFPSFFFFIVFCLEKLNVQLEKKEQKS